MTPAYATKLGKNSQITSIEVQKINGLPLETYKIDSAEFLIQNTLRRV